VPELADTLEFREVTPECWPDLTRLFEARGGPSYCRCMAWRPGGGGDNASKRDALRRVVEQGTPIGLLAYEAGEPIAWCSIEPRKSYRKLGGAADPAGAAVELARSHGADIVEGYPVDADSPSYRFMGLRSTFATAGFEEAGRAGSRRYVARLSLQPAADDVGRS